MTDSNHYKYEIEAHASAVTPCVGDAKFIPQAGRPDETHETKCAECGAVVKAMLVRGADGQATPTCIGHQ